MTTTDKPQGGATSRSGYLLRQAHQAFRTAMEDSLRDVGMSATHFSILIAVSDKPGISGAQLARDAMMTGQSVSESIASLERAGLVVRSRGDRDRRVLRVELTKEGRRQLDEAVPRVRRLEEILVEGLSAEQQAQFHTFLSNVTANLSFPYRR